MKKVLVAMSGGVDSSVAAALLKKQGYFVAGGYMKNFTPESWEGVLDSDCPWEKDMEDIKAVCEKLVIEFRSFNFEREYKDRVIEYFFTEYAAGRTPNPDIMCNKEIKFGLFLDKAIELGFDCVATGHYARINIVTLDPGARSAIGDRVSRDSIVRQGKLQNDKIIFELLKGIDPKKDQSYFLYSLNQFQLSKTLFPVGQYTKSEIRAMAHELGLPNYNKKDSQGICFVGHIKLAEFLKQRIPEKTGEIVDPSGRVIGQHRGAAYYTIGQRKGIGIGGGAPYYIAQKDIVANRLTVSRSEVQSKSTKLTKLHWIEKQPKLPLRCSAKIRYQQPDQECVIFPPLEGEGGGGVKIQFETPQFAIAPGQAAVLYDRDLVLGGGIIA